MTVSPTAAVAGKEELVLQRDQHRLLRGQPQPGLEPRRLQPLATMSFHWHPLFIHTNKPAEGRGRCSRMAVSAVAAAARSPPYASYAAWPRAVRKLVFQPPPSRRRDCHSAGAPSASLLIHLLKAEGGAAEWQCRRRLPPPLQAGSNGIGPVRFVKKALLGACTIVTSVYSPRDSASPTNWARRSSLSRRRREFCHFADTPSPSRLSPSPAEDGMQQSDSLADGYSSHAGSSGSVALAAPPIPHPGFSSRKTRAMLYLAVGDLLSFCCTPLYAQ